MDKREDWMMTSNSVNKPIIVFDVNETLLDIDVLEPLFRRVFNAEHAMREWFAQLILYSEALTLAGAYIPFGELGRVDGIPDMRF